MARVILSGEELMCILKANGVVPDEVIDLHTEGEEIKVRVRTPWPVLKSIRVGMRFAGFEQGEAVLQIATNRLLDRFDWLIDKMLASFPLADHCARWEYPRLHIDVNALLQRQVRGVQITDVVFEDGHYCITTSHARQGPLPDVQTPEEANTPPSCPDSIGNSGRSPQPE